MVATILGVFYAVSLTAIGLSSGILIGLFAGAISFIPFVGATIIALIAALLLYLTGHPHAALFLALWAIVVVSLVDNLVKPVLMRHGMQMRGVIVFFALLGGIAAFGPVGLLLGPLVVSLFLALLRIAIPGERNQQRRAGGQATTDSHIQRSGDDRSKYGNDQPRDYAVARPCEKRAERAV